MSNPFLVLQLRPEAAVSDSEFACILKYGGLSAGDVDRICISKRGMPQNLDLNRYAGVIVGGSPFDISTPAAEKSPLQREVEAGFYHLFDDIVSRDLPFLGCCSGNGLLGSYLGTSITTRFGEPVSCVAVTVTEAGRKDKLLAGFPAVFDVLLGHKEACDSTPAGAELLVTGSACPVQMFRVGQNVYATQFHPEGDAEEFCLRIDAYRNHGYFTPDRADQLKVEVSAKPTPWSHKILQSFVAAYAG